MGSPVRAGSDGRLRKRATARLCYEDLLHTNDKAAGRVTMQFVIGKDGSVTSTKDNGSDIGDAKMVACIKGAFDKITFPQPEGGTVTVIYPLVFAPGD